MKKTLIALGLVLAGTIAFLAAKAPARPIMKKGCNLAVLQMADIDLFKASNRLDRARQNALTSSNEMKHLEAECIYASKYLQFLEDDLKRCGHGIPTRSFRSPGQHCSTTQVRQIPIL